MVNCHKLLWWIFITKHFTLSVTAHIVIRFEWGQGKFHICILRKGLLSCQNDAFEAKIRGINIAFLVKNKKQHCMIQQHLQKFFQKSGCILMPTCEWTSQIMIVQLRLSNQASLQNTEFGRNRQLARIEISIECVGKKSSSLPPYIFMNYPFFHMQMQNIPSK